MKLLEEGRADFLYLSLTDYMQHKFAPDAPESLDFYAAIDENIGRLVELGAIVGATADHGMNAKVRADGSANVIFLETELQKEFGEGCRVICPITDPYVIHHGALGSFATIYLSEDADPDEIKIELASIPGIDQVYSNAEGCAHFELANDRMGDLILVSKQDTVLGTTASRHDLSGLEVPLRSHGGVTEQVVPLIFSQPVVNLESGRQLRNFDIFNIALNNAMN